MAKHGIKSIKPINISTLKAKFKDYTTTTGLKIRLKAVPLKLIDKAGDSVHDPEMPKYTMEVLGGDTQEDILTEEIVKSFESTDPDGLGKKYRALYNEYFIALSKATSERSSKTTKVIQLRGVQFEIPNEPEWLEEMAELEIEVPSNKLKRKLWYLDTEVMANPRDMAAIFQGVMKLSGIPEDALAEAQESFRSLLGDEEGEEDSPEGIAE